MGSEQLVHAIVLRIVEVTSIPEQREASARSEHARDLPARLVRAEPVERLRTCDGVDAVVGERDRLRRPGQRVDPGDRALKLGTHGVDRLDGDDAGAEGHELHA